MDKILSIGALKAMSDSAHVLLKDLKPNKYKGQRNALHHVNKNKKHKILYDNVDLFQLKDVLYVCPNGIIVYFTQHLIFYFPNEGKTTLDNLYLSDLNYDVIACAPKYKYRTFDNMSLEIYELQNLHDEVNITLGSVCDNISVEILLSSMVHFLNDVEQFYINTLYIPYIIHPYRLIVFENNKVKLMSCSLLQYVYSPYIKEKKLYDVLYSHPKVLQQIANPIHLKPFLKECTINLLLDFFHSFYVSIIWIILGDKNELQRNRYYCNGFIDAHEKMIEYINKKKKIRYEDLIDDEDNRHSTCKNPFGYCHCFTENDENMSQLIHRYGCDQLLTVAPVAFDLVVDECTDGGDLGKMTAVVKKEFSLLRHFIQDVIELEKL